MDVNGFVQRKIVILQKLVYDDTVLLSAEIHFCQMFKKNILSQSLKRNFEDN